MDQIFDIIYITKTRFPHKRLPNMIETKDQEKERQSSHIQ